jgi:hypothetical protein
MASRSIVKIPHWGNFSFLLQGAFRPSRGFLPNLPKRHRPGVGHAGPAGLIGRPLCRLGSQPTVLTLLSGLLPPMHLPLGTETRLALRRGAQQSEQPASQPYSRHVSRCGRLPVAPLVCS